jgi:cell division cycle 20-like protein 1 (cofactor of APC complex)
MNKIVSTLKKHDQEVCGLRWSPHDTYLASGGNDNKIYIWDIRKEKPVHTFTDHKAAVRALAWSPHQYGLLLSGGGNRDKTLKLWNVTGGHLVESIETESQVQFLL